MQLDKIKVHVKVRVPDLNKQNGISILNGMQKLPKCFKKIQNSFIKRFIAKGQ